MIYIYIYGDYVAGKIGFCTKPMLSGVFVEGAAAGPIVLWARTAVSVAQCSHIRSKLIGLEWGAGPGWTVAPHIYCAVFPVWWVCTPVGFGGSELLESADNLLFALFACGELTAQIILEVLAVVSSGGGLCSVIVSSRLELSVCLVCRRRGCWCEGWGASCHPVVCTEW